MSNFNQQFGGKKTRAPLVLPQDTDFHGTHFSHNYVGGYIEVPTLEYRNTIPCSTDGLNTDGYSSGRRKLGMLVYVIDEDKYYRLIAKKSTGEEVSIAELDNTRAAQKMVWLDQTLAVDDFDDGPLGGDATYDILVGTGNPDDSWKEVFKPSLSTGGDDYINETFPVIGVSIGSYKDGDSVNKDEALEDVIKKILQKRIAPTYTSPSLSVSTNIAVSQEIGSVISPQISPSWAQGDAGVAIEYLVYKDGVAVGPASSSPSAYTDSNVTLSANIAYKASITWSDGLVKNDNMGDPDPTCRILSNSGSPLFSNTITFVPKRAVYYIADAGTSAPTSSAQIKSFTSNIALSNGSNFSFNVSTSAKRIVIAFPASYGDITKVIDSGTGYDVKNSFSNTSVQIGGVNDYSPVAYNVYTSILGASYGTQVTYTVTI